MSRSYISSPPQAPPWRVAGLLYFYFYILHIYIYTTEDEVLRNNFPEFSQAPSENYVIFQVLTTANTKMVFSLVEFTDVSEVLTDSIVMTLKMEAVSTYESSVKFY
jgi:hypothetical protein